MKKFFNEFPNDGYFSDSLNKKAFKHLLSEGLECAGKSNFFTGVKDEDGNQTCSHYQVSQESFGIISDTIGPLIERYRNKFPHVNSIGVLSSPSPFVFGAPWFNIQKPHEYLGGHMHEGILSYTMWLKLPKQSQFKFFYPSITGKVYEHSLNLTPKDEGKFIIFPSTLYHTVYPYKSDNPDERRISLSGNICLQGRY